MDENTSPDHETPCQRSKERTEQAQDETRLMREELSAIKLTQEETTRFKDLKRVCKVHEQLTTFEEFIQACHELQSLPLRVRKSIRHLRKRAHDPIKSFCPTRLLFWQEFPARQQETYNSV
jgi:hypothetical protein